MSIDVFDIGHNIVSDASDGSGRAKWPRESVSPADATSMVHGEGGMTNHGRANDTGSDIAEMPFFDQGEVNESAHFSKSGVFGEFSSIASGNRPGIYLTGDIESSADKFNRDEAVLSIANLLPEARDGSGVMHYPASLMNKFDLLSGEGPQRISGFGLENHAEDDLNRNIKSLFSTEAKRDFELELGSSPFRALMMPDGGALLRLASENKFSQPQDGMFAKNSDGLLQNPEPSEPPTIGLTHFKYGLQNALFDTDSGKKPADYLATMELPGQDSADKGFSAEYTPNADIFGPGEDYPNWVPNISGVTPFELAAHWRPNAALEATGLGIATANGGLRTDHLMGFDNLEGTSDVLGEASRYLADYTNGVNSAVLGHYRSKPGLAGEEQSFGLTTIQAGAEDPRNIYPAHDFDEMATGKGLVPEYASALKLGSEPILDKLNRERVQQRGRMDGTSLLAGDGEIGGTSTMPQWLEALAGMIVMELKKPMYQSYGGLADGAMAGQQTQANPSGKSNDPLHVKIVGLQTPYQSHMPVVSTASLPSQSLPVSGQVFLSP